MQRPTLSLRFATLAIFLLTIPVFALHVVANIPVGTGITAVAINNKTNRLYVVNTISGSLSVIDGFSNHIITSIPVGHQPVAVGVNYITNRIYVLNSEDESISVVDGNTNVVTSTVTGIPGVALAINSLTNRIYVADQLGNQVLVLAGSNNAVIANLGVTSPGGLAVSQTTNRVYGASLCQCDVFVIDGATNEFLDSIQLQGNPTLIPPMAVDDKTALLYLANHNGDTSIPDVSVISTTDNSQLGIIKRVGDVNALGFLPGLKQVITSGGIDPNHRTIVLSDADRFKVVRSLRVGRGPSGIAFSSATQMIYVANTLDGTLAVIARN